MKNNIHPPYQEVTFTCSCGNVIKGKSTITKNTQIIEVCSQCHPFYTGKQKLIDTRGRVFDFQRKYGLKPKAAPASKQVGQ